MIEIKHLRLLRMLEQEGSMAAAARALGYSQPAVTQQLQALERAVGTPIVLRGSSGIRLTPAGQLLRDHGERVLDLIDLATVEIESLRTLNAGTVRIAAFPSAAATIVPAAMQLLRAKHPNVSFSVTEATPQEALDMLGAGRCDVAVVFRYSSEQDLAAENVVRHPLLREDVHLACPPDYPTPEDGVVPLTDLWDAAWIAGCPKCSGNIIDSCRAVGFSPRIEHETDDYVAVQSLARNGFGVSLIPDLILSIVRLPGLKLVRPFPEQFREVEAVSTRGLMMTPGVSLMVVSLTEAARGIAAVTGGDEELQMRSPRAAKPVG
jgi:molybdate transport repressor ModE-like protein